MDSTKHSEGRKGIYDRTSYLRWHLAFNSNPSQGVQADLVLYAWWILRSRVKLSCYSAFITWVWESLLVKISYLIPHSKGFLILGRSLVSTCFSYVVFPSYDTKATTPPFQGWNLTANLPIWKHPLFAQRCSTRQVCQLAFLWALAGHVLSLIFSLRNRSSVNVSRCFWPKFNRCRDLSRGWRLWVGLSLLWWRRCWRSWLRSVRTPEEEEEEEMRWKG